MSNYKPIAHEDFEPIHNCGDEAKEQAASELAAPPGCASLEIKLNGETPEQLWSNLLGLLTYAVECKQAQGAWPHMVATDDGKISVRHNSA